MTTKAAHYLEKLDEARCDGNWPAVPELVRKVRKHAQDRACITLTAETECAISNVTNASSGQGAQATRPSTSTTAQSLDVSDRLPNLLAAIEAETNYPEDKFQAQVCVGWLHWVVAEYNLATARLPKLPGQENPELDPTNTKSEWTNVCALKCSYLRANCLTRNYQRAEALAAFRAGLPSLDRVWAGRGVRKQLRYWAELYLTEHCMLSSQALQENETPVNDGNAFACFRAWARFWSAISTSVTGGYGFKGSVPRRRIWSEYYLALSRVLEDDLPFPQGNVENTAADLTTRSQLRIELKTTETTYRTLLMGETSFPRAEEEREEVEAFVKLVVKNWAILGGRGWREHDLGRGGRNSLSRGVLDILYGAATKTFHSPAILRSLFIVHIGVAEFDLAFKAFDSYMEIVKKAKARVEKTGKAEPDLDDDGTVLETMSQCVLALCRYGHYQSAEKARHLGAELEDWLANLPQIKPSDNGTPLIPDNDARIDLHPAVSPQTIALAWQAIGMAHAHWSRATSEAASRTEIQAKAVRCLRRSLASDLGRSKDVRSFFALGLLLAERRELAASIEVVRAALVASKGQDQSYSLQYGQYWQERSLIPMWHLLALLLSAKQDYASAARACEGALEQFNDPHVLFGQADSNYQSEHLNDVEAGKASRASRKALVDDMDDLEKEGIMEVKMTQLALVELLDGPDVAVNASSELLTLFSRLFGNVSVQPVLNLPKAKEPPKTSGTMRSIRGSIFGNRHDRSQPSTREPSSVTISEHSAALPARPATAQTAVSGAPTIHVSQDPTSTARREASLPPARSKPPTRSSLKKTARSQSQHRASTTSQQSTMVDGEAFFTPTTETEQSDFFTFSSKKQLHRVSSFSRGRTMPSLSSYLSSNSKTTDYSELAVDDTHSSANLLPLVSFSKDQEKAQRTTLLVRVWLMIAGFYRRAGMFADCGAAVSEAQSLVRGLEADLSREPAGSTGIKAVGWAESKSIDDLWGDIWSEHGLLSAAKEAPYAARAEFESALTHCPDHPDATVGLSNILLDIYSEALLPPPSISPLRASDSPWSNPVSHSPHKRAHLVPELPSSPLGLGPSSSPPSSSGSPAGNSHSAAPNGDINDDNGVEPSIRTTSTRSTSSTDALLPAAYKATCLPLGDRLAARDRAYALLSGLTRLGTGWNSSEAWFALARAHEESGQPDRAKEVLWWCVELEEATGVREWQCLGGGGYII